MRGRLNSIQKSMLQWNQLHPYNAVHVMQVPGTLDAARLRACVNNTLARHGLRSLRLDLQRFVFAYDFGSTECDFQIITNPEEPLSTLIAEMERQLNLEFSWTRPFSPFRFLVLPAENAFFFGVAYFHPAADAESVVHLLRDIVMAYMEDGVPSDAGNPFDLYRDGRAHLLHRRPLVLARKIISFPRQWRNMRQSHRPRHSDAENMSNGFAHFSLGPEQLDCLVAAAKSWRVTINDLFIGVLMKSLTPCALGREEERRRRKMSIGCIVNIRKDLGVDSPRVFGVFLGSFTVTHAMPRGITLREVSTDIRQQTSQIKKRKLYLGTPLELGLARFMFRCFSPARRKRFYAKHYPLWGGVTNMNLNSIWNENDRTAALDYFRAVSTGPVTPLALSVTTVGNRVNIGLSYRAAVFSRDDIEGLERRFREQVEETRNEA